MAVQKKIILERKKGLYLREAGVKGRGVFCTHDIAPGTALEVSPAVILNDSATAHVDKTILVNYTFETGHFSKRLRERLHIKKTGRCSSVIMGIASFCNHGEKPNAEIVWEERGGTVYYSLVATRRIPKNTEICTSYGEGWFDDRI
jgi:SET domain-containing protein